MNHEWHIFNAYNIQCIEPFVSQSIKNVYILFTHATTYKFLINLQLLT